MKIKLTLFILSKVFLIKLVSGLPEAFLGQTKKLKLLEQCQTSKSIQQDLVNLQRQLTYIKIIEN